MTSSKKSLPKGLIMTAFQQNKDQLENFFLLATNIELCYTMGFGVEIHK